MPRAARKSNKQSRPPSADADIEIGDVTAKVYPDGIPQDPDGQVSSEGTIPVAQARKIGALTSDAAAANKHVARQIDHANKGESVSWNSDDPFALFDGIRAAFPSVAFRLFIKDVDSQEQYAPPSMSQFRDSSEFYTYMSKNVHRNKRTAKYEITFKQAGNSAIRGKGFLMMPDSIGDTPAAPPQAPQAVWNGYGWTYPQSAQQPLSPPPFGMGGPPNPYGGGGYGAPPGYGQPQPAPQAPPPVPQNVHIHNQMPPQQQPPEQQHQAPPPYYPPPPPQAPVMMPQMPPSMDPSMMAWMQQQTENQNRLQLMIAEVIGANRARAEAPVHAPAPPQPPPGYTYAPVPGYIPPGFEPPPGYTLQPIALSPQYAPQGVGAPPLAPVAHAAVPPAPPPLVPQIPAATNPFGIDVGGIMKTLKSVEDMKKLFGVGQQVEAPEAPEPAEVIPPPLPEVTSVPLGSGPDAWMYVHNKDGSINGMGMVMANLGRLPKLLHDAAAGVGKMNEVVEDAARRAPIQANVYAPHGGPVVEPRRLIQVAPPPAPPPAPVQNTQQHASLIPNVPRA